LTTRIIVREITIPSYYIDDCDLLYVICFTAEFDFVEIDSSFYRPPNLLMTKDGLR
jgi:hypothetical protein